MATPILATKQFIPVPRPGAVIRRRFLELLNEGQLRKLTLVSAPAGFGKTTLVSEWAASCRRLIAWLSLDEGDDSPARFLVYLLSTLQRIKPNLGVGILAALQSPQPPAIDIMLATLLNEIATIPDDFREDTLLAIKPATMSYEEAAPVSYGAVAAVCYLRDKGHVRPGQRVLIIGATGSVGSYAVQIAAYMGAEVTAVCGTRNLDMVRALGATHVIDYTQEDFSESGARYDLVFDAAGKSAEAKARKALAADGIYLTIMKNGGTGSERAQGLAFLKEMIQAGKLRSVIDRCYPLEQTAEAHRYVDTAQKRGHVVITV